MRRAKDDYISEKKKKITSAFISAVVSPEP
jgi:hypothetical protein